VENVDIEALIKRVEMDLETAQAGLRAAQGRVDELLTVREGLRLAAERYPDAVAANTSEPEPDEMATGDQEPDGTSVSALAGSAVSDSFATGSLDGRGINGTGSMLHLRQADACMVVLRTAGRPLTTREVFNRMQQAGRPEEHEQVRSSLTYLKRVKRIRRVGHEWEISDAPAMLAAGATTAQ
jgi:hypothetical protein